MVVEVNKTVNHLIGFREGIQFTAVNALGFEDGEEVFCHSVVIRISPP